MKAFQFVVFLLVSCSVTAASAHDYVVNGASPSASDSNAGTASSPFKTITAAVSHLQPGDNILIHGGVYREQVKLSIGGTAQKPIVIKAAPGESVILDEADAITGWQKVTDPGARPLWIKAPFAQGTAFPVDRTDLANRTQLMVDNFQYAQVVDTAQLKPGTFYYDPANGGAVTLWPLPPKQTAPKLAAGTQWWESPANLASEDINKHDVEISTRSWGILANGELGFITLDGLTVRHGNDALGIIIGGDHEPCHDIVVENCTVEYANGAFAARGNNFLIKHCYFHDNGGGSGAGLTNSIMEDTIFDHNTAYGADHGFSAGGIKLLWTVNTIIRRCQFINNDGPGIWFDTGNCNDIIEQNFCSYNSGSGIMMEVSPNFASYDPSSKPEIDGWAPQYMGTKPGAPAGPNIIRNNVCIGNRWDGSSGSGILLQLSSDQIVANNTLVDNAMYGIFVRYHPYNDWTHRVWDNTLINNLCVDNGGSQIFITPDPLDKPGIVARNRSDYNLFWVTKSWMNASESSRFPDYGDDRAGYGEWGKTQSDLTYSTEETFKIFGYEEHSIQGEPYFISRATLDFGLQPDSFAIGAGVPTPYVTDDYLGHPRPTDRAPSIGALEYVGDPSGPPVMPMRPGTESEAPAK